MNRSVALPDLSAYPDVLTRRHLAKILGCSVRSIELQVAAGTFPIPRMRHLPTLGWSKARVLQLFGDETFDPIDSRAPIRPTPPALPTRRSA